MDIYIYIYRKYTRALTFENVGQIAVAIKHQEARARRGHTGHTGQSALLPSVKTPKDKNQDVSSSESSHAGSYLGVGGGNGGRRKLARASGYGRGEGGGGRGGGSLKFPETYNFCRKRGSALTARWKMRRTGLFCLIYTGRFRISLERMKLPHLRPML